MSGVQPDGRPWSCSMGMTSSGTVSDVEFDWTVQVNSAWLNGSHGLDAILPTGTTLDETKTEQLHIVTIGTVDHLRVNGIARDVQTATGASANASLPEQNVILVTLRTATPGREGSGRIHLPAPDVTLVTAGELQTTPATRVSTAIEALRSGMATAGHTPALITYKKPLSGTAVGTTKPITLVETDRIIRTLRQRNKSRKAVYI